MSRARNTKLKEEASLKLRDVLEEFDERLGARPEPEILTLTEKMGFVSQRERFSKRLAIADTSNYKFIGLNDIAFNPYLLWANAIAQNTGWKKAIISPLYPTFRVRAGYSSRFVNYLLCSGYLRSRYGSISYGSVPRKRRATVNDFLDLPIPPQPSLEEQERIVKLLDTGAALQRLRAQADQRTDALAAAMFYEFFGEPISNPKGFPRKTLGELIEFIGGSQPPRSTFTYESSPDNIRLVQIRDFKSDDHKTYIPKALARRFLNEDDVMIGRYGPPLFQILRGLSGSYNVALIKAVPKSEVTKEFIFHLLQESNLHSKVVANSERTAGQTGVNLDLLEQYPVFLPPLPLQKEFAERVTEVRALEAKQTASRTHLDALFKSMLHRAFNGEL
jgi:restriction endonuclease S subunit